MSTYYTDDHVTLHHGDAASVLATLPAGSVDCIVTSPPYLGLRDYGVEPTEWPEVTYSPMRGLPSITIPAMSCALGAESDPAAFVGHLVLLFREARRVLADDGTMWVNLGDSWVDKDLLGVPWMVAFALKADGWILRNDVAWAKPNAMPSSVTDRLSNRHERVFLLAKQAEYWFDLDAVREPAITADRPGPRSSYENLPNGANQTTAQQARATVGARGPGLPLNDLGRNPGDVWEISTTPFPGAHFATMPPALAERCILAGCKPGGTVLDPFSGSGTTGMAAAKHGRRYVGVELNEEYLVLSLRTRLAQGTLDFGEAS